MLQRDKYVEDYCKQYYPNASFEEFRQDVTGHTSPFHKIIIPVEKLQNMSSIAGTHNNLVAATLALSCLPIILHKKIPFLNRAKSIRSRIGLGVLWVFLPANTVGYYANSKLVELLQVTYQANLPEYLKYKQYEDVNIINPNISWAEY